MTIGPVQVVRGLVALVIAACCTLDSGAQVQLPTVQNPIKDISAVAITPDGRRVLFSGTDIKGVSGTWLKDVDTGVVSAFTVSDQPDFRGGVFSPDGQSIVFTVWRSSTLRRVSASGGAGSKICDVTSIVAMDWGRRQPRRVR
jgi:Tol biopolymer transport system component